jgi:hypothetical protein
MNAQYGSEVGRKNTSFQITKKHILMLRIAAVCICCLVITCRCCKKKNPAAPDNLSSAHVLFLKKGNRWVYDIAKRFDIQSDTTGAKAIHDTIEMVVVEDAGSAGWYPVSYTYRSSSGEKTYSLKMKDSENGLFSIGYELLLDRAVLFKHTASSDTLLMLPSESSPSSWKRGAMTYKMLDDEAITWNDSTVDCHLLIGYSSEKDTTYLWFTTSGIYRKESVSQITDNDDTLNYELSVSLVEYSFSQ